MSRKINWILHGSGWRQSASSETEGLNESGSDNGEDIVRLKSEEHCNVNEWCDIFSRLEFTRHFNFLI